MRETLSSRFWLLAVVIFSVFGLTWSAPEPVNEDPLPDIVFPTVTVAVPSPSGGGPSPSSSPTSTMPVIHTVTPKAIKIPGVTPKSGARVIAQPQYYGYNPQTRKSDQLMYDTPDNLFDVSWWSADPKGAPAPKPGASADNAYIAVFWGHTALDDKHGVFAKLGTVEVGDLGYIQGRDEKGKQGVLTMRAIKSYQVPKDPQTAFDRSLNKAPTGTQVATGTCSGDVDWATGHHEDMRIVLWTITEWTPEG